MIKQLYKIKDINKALFTIVVPPNSFGDLLMESVNTFPMQTICVNLDSLTEFVVSDDEESTQPFNYENLNVEGEFTVEKVDDVIAIKVTNGSMNISKKGEGVKQ